LTDSLVSVSLSADITSSISALISSMSMASFSSSAVNFNALAALPEDQGVHEL